MGTQQQVSVDAKLQVGQVTESIEVSGVGLAGGGIERLARPGDRQPETDAICRTWAAIPFMLSKLAQNVVPVGNPAYNRMEDQSGSSQISIAGGPVRGNNYLIDGVPITDATNRAIIIPSLEAVQEVKDSGQHVRRRNGSHRRRHVQHADELRHQYLSRQPLRPSAAHRVGCQQLLQQRRRRAHHRSAQRHLGRELRRRCENSQGVRRQEQDVLLSGFRALRRHPVVVLRFRHPDGPRKDGRLFAEPQFQRHAADYLRSARTQSTASARRFPGNIIPTSRLNPAGLAMASQLSAGIERTVLLRRQRSECPRPAAVPRGAIHRQGRRGFRELVARPA